MALAPLSGTCCRYENDVCSKTPRSRLPFATMTAGPAADIGRGWQKPPPKPYLLPIAPRLTRLERDTLDNDMLLDLLSSTPYKPRRLKNMQFILCLKTEGYAKLASLMGASLRSQGIGRATASSIDGVTPSPMVPSTGRVPIPNSEAVYTAYVNAPKAREEPTQASRPSPSKTPTDTSDAVGQALTLDYVKPGKWTPLPGILPAKLRVISVTDGEARWR